MPPPLLILCGDETGLLKLVDVRRKAVVRRWGTQGRVGHISRAAWLPAGSVDNELSSARVAVLTRGGAVRVWDTASGSLLHTCTGAGAEGALLACQRGRFITCAADGMVRVFSQSAKDADAAQGASKVGACVRGTAMLGLSATPVVATGTLTCDLGL